MATGQKRTWIRPLDNSGALGEIVESRTVVVQTQEGQIEVTITEMGYLVLQPQDKTRILNVRGVIGKQIEVFIP